VRRHRNSSPREPGIGKYQIPKTAEGEALYAGLKAQAERLRDCGSRASYPDPEGDLICPTCERPKAPSSKRATNGYDRRVANIGRFMRRRQVDGERGKSPLDRAAAGVIELWAELPRELRRSRPAVTTAARAVGISRRSNPSTLIATVRLAPAFAASLTTRD
jgi:hypothetical protein